MKAVTYSEYGPPSVLQVKEVARPTPRDNEILIRVRAAEATKSDCEMRSFRYSVKWFWLPLRLALGIRRPRRQILGGYFAGEIADVGEGVSGFEVGEAVFGCAGLRLGAYGEFVSLPARYTIVPKPTAMSFSEAAAVPLGGLNALYFMRLAKIQHGENVLINGAGGSIGAHAIQIAKSMGGVVTAVDKGMKKDAILRFGADHFIDFESEDFTTGARRFDVIFDMVPYSSYGKCMRALKPNGRYLLGNPRLSVMIRSIFTRYLTDKTATFAFAHETKKELHALRGMIDRGELVSIVDSVYPIEQAAEAHSRVETEQRLGAIVLSLGPSESDAGTSAQHV